MRRLILLTAGATLTVMLAWPAVALGHVELISSSPAAGENLATAPTEVTITFDDELDPDYSSFTVTDADGDSVGTGEVDLAIADRNVLSGSVTIVDPGMYTVTYTVAGIDGHRIDGSFTFGYQATGQSGGNPDTALPAPEPPRTSVAGVLLLALATLIAAQRVFNPDRA
jgi:methionine-rich copper-binding protein CopC